MIKRVNPMRFDAETHSIAISTEFAATLAQQKPDPQQPAGRATFGIAVMTENSPHGGERHPDGDEVLYLIAGKVKVVFLDNTAADMELTAGDGLIVPQGVWHRVDILAPSKIVYLTPGPNNEYRAVENDA